MTTDIHKELEEEYTRFIEFGGLLNQKMRKYLSQYLQNKFDPDRHLIPDLKDKYYNYFKVALDEIFIIDGLADVVAQNQSIRKRIILDTIYWLKKSYKKIRKKHPYEEEQTRLESWSITPFHIFIKRWPNIIIYLSEIYERHELDTDFFKSKFESLINSSEAKDISQANQKQVDLIYNDLLSQWDALLYAKILAFQMNKFEEEKQGYIEFVTEKVTEYNKLKSLVEPFSEYFGWDMSRKLWQKTSFKILEQYGKMLKDEKSIKELADLLGSMREAEIVLEEETYEKTIIRQEWIKDDTLKSEIVGIHNSNDLTHMLSSEVSLLSDPNSEVLFLKKYAEKKLLTFKYEDRKLVKSKYHIMEVNQKSNLKEKGPFIICVDTSESMDGRPGEIAKVMSFGILKMAMHQRRKAYLINFSAGIKTLDLYNIAESIDAIAEFLQMSFNGGTDASLALYEALRQLQTENYEDADVLMVSDFIMYKLEQDVQQQIKHYQLNKNTQFHSLTIGKQANQEVTNYFDTNWQYNPKEKGIIKSITYGLKDIGERL